MPFVLSFRGEFLMMGRYTNLLRLHLKTSTGPKNRPIEITRYIPEVFNINVAGIARDEFL